MNGTTAPFRPRASIPFSKVPNGIPQGALSEISGALGLGKTRWVLDFIAELTPPTWPIAWIEEEFTFYPPAFLPALFIEGKTQSLWCALQIIQSQLYPILILRTSSTHGMQALQKIRELRRLQLAAEKSNTAVILLPDRPTQEGSWTLSLQAELTAAGQLQIIRGHVREHSLSALHIEA